MGYRDDKLKQLAAEKMSAEHRSLVSSAYAKIAEAGKPRKRLTLEEQERAWKQEEEYGKRPDVMARRSRMLRYAIKQLTRKEEQP